MFYILIILLFLIIVFVILLIIAFILQLKVFNFHLNRNPKIKIFSHLDFPDLSAESFSFTLGKDVIKGYIYKNKNSLAFKNLIIFFHGYGGGHQNYMHEIHRLTLDDNLVISYDNLGCFDSSGKMKGIPESLVVAKAFSLYFKNNFNDYKKYPLVLMGHSWGAYAAINSARFFVNSRKIVAIAGFSSSNFFTRGNNIFLKILRPFIFFINLIMFKKYSLYTSKKTLRKINIPCLLIHGELDNIVTPNQSFLIYKKIKNKNIKIIIEKEKYHSPQLTIKANNALRDFLGGKIKEDNLDYGILTELDENIFKEINNFINL